MEWDRAKGGERAHAARHRLSRCHVFVLALKVIARPEGVLAETANSALLEGAGGDETERLKRGGRDETGLVREAGEAGLAVGVVADDEVEAGSTVAEKERVERLASLSRASSAT